MMKNSSLTICFLMLLCISCRSNEEQSIDEGLTLIDKSKLAYRYVITDNFNQSKIIKLETTDEGLLGWISKVEIDDSLIFIQDVNEKIFVFDDKGQFRNTIGKIGPGPKERLTLLGFSLDKKAKQTHLYDIIGRATFIYTYAGEFVQKNQHEREYFSKATRVTTSNSGDVLLTLYNDNSSLYNYRVISGNEIRECLPYIAYGEKTTSDGESTISKNQEDTYACRFLSDTIYKYDERAKHFKPTLFFKGIYQTLTKEDLQEEEPFEIALDAYTIARKKGLSRGVSNLYCMDNFILFTFTEENALYKAFWNIKEKTGYYYNPYDEIVEQSIFTSLSNVCGTHEDYLICVVPSEEAILHTEEVEDSRLKDILLQTKEEDNPILIFHKID